MQKGMVSFITHTVYSNHFRGLLQRVLCGDFCGLLRGDLRGVDKLVSALLFIPLETPCKMVNVSSYTHLTLASVAKN